MGSQCKMLFLCLMVCSYQFVKCELDDYKVNIDGFMDAFDDTYPTEVNSQILDDVNEGNEVPAEASIVPDNSKANEVSYF